MSIGLPGLSAEESNTGSVHPSRFGPVLTTCILIISTRRQRSEAKTISESSAVSFTVGVGTRTDDATADAFRQGDLLRRTEKLPHGWCCRGSRILPFSLAKSIPIARNVPIFVSLRVVVKATLLVCLGIVRGDDFVTPATDVLFCVSDHKSPLYCLTYGFLPDPPNG